MWDMLIPRYLVRTVNGNVKLLTCFSFYKHNVYKHTEPDFGENLSIY